MFPTLRIDCCTRGVIPRGGSDNAHSVDPAFIAHHFFQNMSRAYANMVTGLLIIITFLGTEHAWIQPSTDLNHVSNLVELINTMKTPIMNKPIVQVFRTLDSMN